MSACVARVEIKAGCRAGCLEEINETEPVVSAVAGITRLVARLCTSQRRDSSVVLAPAQERSQGRRERKLNGQEGQEKLQRQI